jgi:hypothetical protein
MKTKDELVKEYSELIKVEGDTIIMSVKKRDLFYQIMENADELTKHDIELCGFKFVTPV